MGLLAECSKCKKRISIKRTNCSCGHNVKKASHKNYWIEFYLDGRRRRERIGPSKLAADHRLREVLRTRTEGRYIEKDPATKTTLAELCNWYLRLPEVESKKSYRRDKEFIRHLLRILGEQTKIKHLNTGKAESYQQNRLAEPSPRHLGENIRPATVNKEVSCLKTILNRAVRHGKLTHNPIGRVKKLPENNIRMRILSEDEFEGLLNACANHIKPIVLTAYFTGMRRSEVLYLSWKEVDLKKGFIRLPEDRTKTKAARSIPLHPRVQKMLARTPRGLHTDRVFLLKGRPFDEFKKAFKNACSRANIEDFTFHDLRHCALNNLRLAGNDYFRIMAVSGHKTTAVFKRYNLITEEELSNIRWHDETKNKRQMDTYKDTKAKGVTS